MKTRNILITIALLGAATFTSCKKDYVCTCTTVVGTGSNVQTHDVNDATYGDAKNTCNNYQDQANSTLPGGTTCHL